MQRHSTIGEVIALMIDIKTATRNLEKLEAQLEDIRNIPKPVGGSEAHIAAHSFLVDVLPRLSSRVLLDAAVMARLLQAFQLSESIIVEFRSTDEDAMMALDSSGGVK